MAGPTRDMLPSVQFRSQEVEAELSKRAEEQSLGLVAKRDLGRYYDLLRRERATLTLSAAEAMLICDVCNGTIFNEHSVAFLWAEVADGIRLNGADEKWQVDGAPLVAKLRVLTPGQAYALADGVEQFWTDDYRPMEPYDALRQLGLIRKEPEGDS